MKQLLVLGAFVMALTGCGTPAEDELQIGLGEGDTRAYPFAIKSCTDDINNSPTDSLKAASVDFGLFNFRWYGKEIVKIKTLTIKLKGSSLTSSEFTKTLGGTELEDTFNGTSMTIPAAVDGIEPTLITTGCSVRIGGVAFKDPKAAGFATGTITLFGVTEDSNGDQDVIVATADLSIRYDGDPSL